ncbi:MAG: hypothetical protein Q9160_006518 [Pyrenula sp. 1 TL-2023]
MAPNLFSNEEQKQLFWYWTAAVETSATSFEQVPRTLGIGALQARANFFGGKQGPIPPDQWMQEVLHWYTVILATIQRLTVDMVTGPSDESMNKYMNKTVPEFSSRQSCLPQKVRSTAFTSFSVFGLAVTFILGSLIILLANVIEPFSAFLQKHYKKGTYQRLEWVSNETLQLQRMVHEELGLGTWSGAAETVPVTEPGERLGLLDVSEEKHPIMVRGSSSQTSVAGKSDAKQEKLSTQITAHSISESSMPGENRQLLDTNWQSTTGKDLKQNPSPDFETQKPSYLQQQQQQTGQAIHDDCATASTQSSSSIDNRNDRGISPITPVHLECRLSDIHQAAIDSDCVNGDEERHI